MFIKTPTTYLLLSALLLSNTACSLKPQSTAEIVDQNQTVTLDESCSQYPDNIETLPNEVLVGTDIYTRQSFQKTSNLPAKKYRTDIGGVRLTAAFRQLNGKYILTRDFQEAGLEKHTATYTIDCVKNALLFTQNAKAILVAEGLLLLEPHTQADGLPSDLWIYYPEE